jgi:nitroreductase
MFRQIEAWPLPYAVPSPPLFGEPAPFAEVSAQTLALLASRRSATPQSLSAPGPSPDQLRDLLRLAARVPDHGKLTPWRFIVLRGEAKAEFAARLEALAREQPDPAKAAAVLFKLKAPPLAVAVVSRVVEPAPIPAWEQQLSAGACCMTLMIAAQAMGFGANWITDWYGYDARAGAVLGLHPGERVAGFVLLGTPTEAPLERVRPDVEAITSDWAP